MIDLFGAAKALRQLCPEDDVNVAVQLRTDHSDRASVLFTLEDTFGIKYYQTFNVSLDTSVSNQKMVSHNLCEAIDLAKEQYEIRNTD